MFFFINYLLCLYCLYLQNIMWTVCFMSAVSWVLLLCCRSIYYEKISQTSVSNITIKLLVTTHERRGLQRNFLLFVIFSVSSSFVPRYNLGLTIWLGMETGYSFSHRLGCMELSIFISHSTKKYESLEKWVFL